MRKTLLALALAAPLLASPTLLGSLWSLLSAVWSASSPDEGCIFDPWGGCAPAPQPQTDAGCIMDPYGGCAPAPQPQTDEGCILDPYGGPRCS